MISRLRLVALLGAISYSMLGQSQIANTQLYRMTDSVDHVYSTDCREVQNAVRVGGWRFEGVIAYIFSTQTSNTSPLYRFSSSYGHFYTSNEDEMNFWKNQGVPFEGVVGYVSAVPRNNLVPLYRIHYKNGGWLYTASEAEHSSTLTLPNTVDEGNVGWVSISNNANTCQMPSPEAPIHSSGDSARLRLPPPPPIHFDLGPVGACTYKVYDDGSLTCAENHRSECVKLSNATWYVHEGCASHP